jgi:hypothetical protein
MIFGITGRVAGPGEGGRAYRYRATVSRDEYTGDLMGEGAGGQRTGRRR